MDEDTARSKKEELIKNLMKLPSLLVAYSGGVDSTFLLALAHQALGDRVLAATAGSITYPVREKEESLDFPRQRGIEHIIFSSDETGIQEFVSNTPDRCYHCKMSLSQSLIEIAKERGIRAIAHGANLDDLGDYRPGLRAAEEMGVIAPLVDAGLGKEEIRFLSREMGLPTWDKPAMACLASRIPYGIPITVERLKMVEEAEEFLLDCGFRQCRVRHHGTVARIEVESSQIGRIVEERLREEVVRRLREIGFVHISIDLEGYVSGSMNLDLGNKGSL